MKFYKQPWIGLAFSVFAVGNVYADTVIASKDYVDTAVGAKQDKLGGTADAGKVVVATGTAGTVDYKAIDTTPTANSTNLITSGAVQAAVNDATSAIGSGAIATNALATNADGDKLTKVSAIKAATSTTATATFSNNAITIATNDNEHVPTTKAVADGISALTQKIASVESNVENNFATKDLDTLSTTGKANIAAQGTFNINTQYNDNTVGEAIKNNTLNINALYDSTLLQKNSTVAWNEADINSQNPDEKNLADRYVNKEDRDKLIPSVAAVDVRVDSAVNKVIARQGSYTEGWDNNDVVAPQKDNTNNSNLGAAKGNADDFIPTIAAVDARINSVTNKIAKQGTLDISWDKRDALSRDPQLATRFGTNLGDTFEHEDEFVPTIAAVEARVKVAENKASDDLDNLTVTSAMIQDGTIATADIDNNAVTSDKIKNGEVKTDDIADTNVTTSKLADGAVTTVKLDADAVTNAKLADNAVQTENVVDKSLKYQNDMNNTALYDINTGDVPANDVCTKTAPCMLTYYKEGGNVYTRWTPLDADGLSANAATTDAGAAI